MTWKKIFGQNRVKRILSKAVIHNKIAHSYCFYGFEGVGKEAIAFEFAKILNCKNTYIEDNIINACDECNNCKSISNLQHPNLIYIHSFPAGSLKSDSDNPINKLSEDQLEELKNQYFEKSLNPYHRIELKNANQIKIIQIRELKRQLSYSSNNDGRRVVIINNAEELTIESANAFLKTLEEPSENTTIILITSRKEALLTTILSRCQKLKFDNLSIDNIMQIFISYYNLDESTTRLIAGLSEGSYKKGLEFASEQISALRDLVVDSLRTVFKKKVYRIELLEKIDKIIESKNKIDTENFLSLLLVWLRDVEVYKLTLKDKLTINTDQIDIIKKFAINYGFKDIKKAINETENAILMIKRNVQLQVILLSLFLKLRNIFIEE